MATIPHPPRSQTKRRWLFTLLAGMVLGGVVAWLHYPIGGADSIQAAVVAAAIAMGWLHWSAATLGRLREPAEAGSSDGKRRRLGFVLIQLGLLAGILGWISSGIYYLVPANARTHKSLSVDQSAPYTREYEYRFWIETAPLYDSASYQETGRFRSNTMVRASQRTDNFGFLAVRAPFALGSRLVLKEEIKQLPYHPLLPVPREAAIGFGLAALASLYLGVRLSMRRRATPLAADETPPPLASSTAGEDSTAGEESASGPQPVPASVGPGTTPASPRSAAAPLSRAQIYWFYVAPLGVIAAGAILPLVFSFGREKQWDLFASSIVLAVWFHGLSRMAFRLRAAGAAGEKRRILIACGLAHLALLSAFLGWAAYGTYCEVPAGEEIFRGETFDPRANYSNEYKGRWWSPPDGSTIYKPAGKTSAATIMRAGGTADRAGYLAVRRPFSVAVRYVRANKVKMLNRHPLLPVPQEAGLIFGAAALAALYGAFRLFFGSRAVRPDGPNSTV